MKHIAYALILMCTPFSSSVAQQNMQAISEGLDLISTFAGKMCGNVPIYSSSQSADLSVTGKVELNEILQKLANVGATASGKIQDSKTMGVLQNELAGALKDQATCNQKIFENLKDIILPKPAAELDQDSRLKLLEADKACNEADFNRANALYNQVLTSYPNNRSAVEKKNSCTNLASESIEAEIGLLVSPAVFMHGDGDDIYQARFSLEIDGSYCGSLSNLSQPEFQTCYLTPGTHSFRLRSLSVYSPNRQNVFRGGSCGGHLKILPGTKQYGMVICLKKPYVYCALFPVEKLYSGFSYKDCKFQ